jgi:large subunit ribosomal protein L3
MGVDQVTIQNLDVVKVDPELNMLVIRGAVSPAPRAASSISSPPSRSTRQSRPVQDISKNPQKASGRNPQKASARNK